MLLIIEMTESVTTISVDVTERKMTEARRALFSLDRVSCVTREIKFYRVSFALDRGGGRVRDIQDEAYHGGSHIAGLGVTAS